MSDKPFVLLALSGRDAARETLDDLAGGERILEFVLPWTPPYEPFEGIRELQLAARRMGPFPAGCLVLDLTEWIGREEEEYFEIAVMYLHDHRHLWNYIFLIREREARGCAALFRTLRAFLTGELREDRTFADRETLAAALRDRYLIDRGAADRLSSLLMRPDARMLRSYPRLNALMEELAREGAVTEDRIAKALRDPASALHLIAGQDGEESRNRESARRSAGEERRSYGKEAV